MNYNDIVRIRYPNYVLTYVGTGEDYYALGWSDFNPSPNPIPKSTLDADIADAIATGISGSLGDLTPAKQDELYAIANLEEGTGFVKKISRSAYALDKNAYLTTITYPAVTSALGYTPYNSTNPSEYTTKTYVDGLVSAGVVWDTPVHAFNFVGTASAPSTNNHENDNYIISAGGNVDAWAMFSPGDRVSWINNQWVFREATSIGCRLGVCFDRNTTPVGDAVGKQDYIGEIVGGDAINGWVWAWTAPQNNRAVFNNFPTSAKYGEAYSYSSVTSRWTAFSTNIVGDGDGLSYSGNILSVNAGAGLEIVSDQVGIKLHPEGGIITSLDGVTFSADQSAGLALETIGTPGTYTTITTDVYGRIISGSSPTTVSGYGITDALTSNMLGVPLGVASLDSSGKLHLTELPTHTHAWSTITSTPNTINGYGILDAQSLLVSGTNIKTINNNTVLGSGDLSVQEILVSGTNIKTINSQSILSSGNLDLQPTLVSATNIKTIAGYSVLGAGDQPISFDNLSDVIITNPLSGQSVFYNGSNWVNVGESGGTSGGGIAKRIWSNNILPVTGTTVITPGATAPTSAQGTQLWTQTITPMSAITTYVVQTSIVGAGTVNNSYITLALFRDNVYIGGSLQIIQSTNNSATLSFAITDRPATILPVTYQVRVGVSTGTWYVNRRPTEVTYGGTQTGWGISEY